MYPCCPRDSQETSPTPQYESINFLALSLPIVQLSHPYVTADKGERERYTHLITECQRIARRDKKTLLSEQFKEIEENRLEKTRDLFKKIRDTKGMFHAKIGTTKGRNSKDLTEAEEIKKRWQEYIEELYKKGLNDSDNHNGMITHLEPDILECDVKWALRHITTKLVEVMEFQLSYFKLFFFHIPHISGIMLFAFLCLAYFT